MAIELGDPSEQREGRGYEGDSPTDLPNKRCNFLGWGIFTRENTP